MLVLFCLMKSKSCENKLFEEISACSKAMRYYSDFLHFLLNCISLIILIKCPPVCLNNSALIVNLGIFPSISNTKK